ncbi:S66 peptidase family protein [Chitinophaga filiformis]|uniref:Muramoyltetrapeptide carboxypeptidase n=1 Tax=Chitinophaga filiformis TaxID=104663 RepID=A0A1G7V8N2_CHIFI|nr:LD-carboxypeptidase [Chitinophaga filiformis]SDG56146.1 muramoyltetrapeptide carboxypeptidase [Chitinophaga filiformis]
MNRKHFLSALATTAGLTTIPALTRLQQAAAALQPHEERLLIPPYLRPGDTIGITCPAGHITFEEIKPAISIMQSWGFKIRVGNTVDKTDFSFGGTDQERRQDMQEMLDDPTIKAIMCARGGYGSARIVDLLDFSHFAQQPKWIIGFSDITVLHCHINRLYGIATLHSKMCNSFPDDFNKAEAIVQQTISSIRDALSGQQLHYTTFSDSRNRTGTAKGVLVGGNLSMIQSVLATNSELNTIGKILFLEEVGEYLYSLDRMFNSLQRAHKLDNLAGLIIGGFNRIKPDDPGEEFGRTVYDIVMEKVKEFKYPVCFGFPVGHQKDNYALKCGVMHQLSVGQAEVTLEEVRD